WTSCRLDTGNPAEEASMGIGQLRHLRVLFCYRNRLTKVPEELENCTRLEILSLTNNQISGFPASFASLTCLRQPDLLAHNKTVHIPSCVYTMKSLVFLHLACNRLECVAEQFLVLIHVHFIWGPTFGLHKGTNVLPLLLLMRG
uniref:Uncharacterized protein n=1 Tax=Hucho hucho TaxID=62062 RepID=A0A4W5QI29_9TELE